jgi:hypothetical protein
LIRALEIRRLDGTTREVDLTELPLALGGTGADIEITGVSGTEPSAWIGLSEGDLFVQVVDGGERVLCNGGPVRSSHWLHDGDELRVGATRIDLELSDGTARLGIGSAVEEVFTEPPQSVVEPGTRTSTTSAGGGAPVKPAEFRPRAPTAAASRRRALRPVRFLPWAGLILLAGAAWILFGMRSVELRITPAPDSLMVEGPWPVVELGGRHVLRPGEFRIVADKRGYRRLEVPLSVGKQTPRVIDLVLEKLPGILIVDAARVVGAEVRIDGELAGTTPLGPLELTPGDHEVSVRAERYAEFRTTVSIEGEGKEQTVTAELAGRWAAVSFRSEPPGAAVLVDGKRIGATPVTVDLLEGRHSYTLVQESYKRHDAAVSVVAGQDRQLPTVTLQWSDATLHLTSRPKGSNVTVDDQFRGLTPIRLALAPKRAHRLEVSKSGYDPDAREVTFAPGESVDLSVTLTARLGEVSIVVSPPDAELRIDGERRSPATQVVQLTAIPHRIEIDKKGYEPFRTTITPRPGFPQDLEVTLKTAEQRERETTPTSIKTAQGHELVLVRGGTLRMGASRREPGRRGNETLRDVRLERPFYISTREISNAEFREFDESHLSGAAGKYNLENDHHPVVRVTWEDAAMFCNWLSARESLNPVYERSGRIVRAARPISNGYRLPTEAHRSGVGLRRALLGARSADQVPVGPPATRGAGFGELCR